MGGGRGGEGVVVTGDRVELRKTIILRQQLWQATDGHIEQIRYASHVLTGKDEETRAGVLASFGGDESIVCFVFVVFHGYLNITRKKYVRIMVSEMVLWHDR